MTGKSNYIDYPLLDAVNKKTISLIVVSDIKDEFKKGKTSYIGLSSKNDPDLCACLNLDNAEELAEEILARVAKARAALKPARGRERVRKREVKVRARSR